MKLRWTLLLSGLLVWMVNSCSSGVGGVRDQAMGPASSRKESAPGQSGDGSSLSGLRKGVDASEAFAPPRKERPGLATGFGESRRSLMPSTAFDRATSQPYGVDAIYYNDREGLKAMGAMDERISGMQTTAGGVMEWGIKGALGYLPTYYSYTSGSGVYRRYVEGSHQGRYSIVLKNVCRCPLQVVLSVDGLDVMDGRPASVKKRGYVVSPGETLEVEGYRTSYDQVATFRFSSVSRSYAAMSGGDTRNVGVIGLAVYAPKGMDPWKWMPKEIQTRENANPFAPAP